MHRVYFKCEQSHNVHKQTLCHHFGPAINYLCYGPQDIVGPPPKALYCHLNVNIGKGDQS